MSLYPELSTTTFHSRSRAPWDLGYRMPRALVGSIEYVRHQHRRADGTLIPAGYCIKSSIPPQNHGHRNRHRKRDPAFPSSCRAPLPPIARSHNIDPRSTLITGPLPLRLLEPCFASSPRGFDVELLSFSSAGLCTQWRCAGGRSDTAQGTGFAARHALLLVWRRSGYGAMLMGGRTDRSRPTGDRCAFHCALAGATKRLTAEGAFAPADDDPAFIRRHMHSKTLRK